MKLFEIPVGRYALAQRYMGYLTQNKMIDGTTMVDAVALYRLAAEQGDQGGQLYLGTAYEKGTGVPQDLEAAAEWYLNP